MIVAPELDRKALGQYMRGVRHDLRLSLTAQESITGLASVVVGSYERGQRNPSLSQLLAWTSGLKQRLAVLGPDEAVLTTRGGGEEFVQYVVTTPAGLEVEQDTRAAAEALARQVHGGRVGYRVNKVGPVEYADGGAPWPSL